MLPTAAGSRLLKTCESKSELEHQNYETWVLQLACLMQTGINGYEIYKTVGMIHAVVFADRAPEANNAQVIGEKLNFDCRLKPKRGEPNGQKSDNCQNDGPMITYLRHSRP